MTDVRPPTAGAEQHVRVHLEPGVGVLQLDRPRALNALTTGMVHQLSDALDRALAAAPRLLLVESTSPRAFCAGGDMRAVAALVAAGDVPAARAFFEAEYRLDLRLSRRPVPQVSLLDGVCMGGGLGLSVHGAYRVVTERSVLAMPETAIGFFPDVGMTHVLPRLAGQVGTYLGLTGARLSGYDALWCGLATHLVPSDALPALREALLSSTGGSVASVLDAHASPRPDAGSWPDASPLAAAAPAVDACFSAGSLREVLARLDRQDDAWADDAARRLRAASPMALGVTWQLLHRGARGSLADAFQAELETAVTVVQHPDFQEGVRAVLVDKDQTPSWSPAEQEPG